MNKSLLTKGVITALVLIGGWASPSILVSSQEEVTPDEVLVPVVTTEHEPVRLEVTTKEVILEHGETLDPQELVVAGRYDTLSLPVVETTELGDQVLTFKATKGLDEVTLTKSISVVDTQAPYFTDSARTIKVEYEEEFDVEVIAGFFEITDDVDGKLEVQIDGTYDDTEPGDYDLTAYAVDSSGNRVEHSFVVNVGEKPKPKVTSYETVTASGNASYSSSNSYAAGWCTWWVAQRRIEIGRPLPNTLGNAATWLGRAPMYGLSVVYGAPVAGAVVYPSYNHVAFVERVNADGSIVISEMGWNYAAWNRNTRTLSASAAASYGYIY
ncbi:MAG: CHAP domain-containing protein [Erysipelothrix sp.]|nr:CHAP domain-containing protein [Erysipelothrix sp.]